MSQDEQFKELKLDDVRKLIDEGYYDIVDLRDD